MDTMWYNFEQCLMLPWVPFKHFTWGAIQITHFKIMCNAKCSGEHLVTLNIHMHLEIGDTQHSCKYPRP
jgi:hypothetical protein